MRAEISRDPKIETGGVLIGYKKQSGNVVVELATDPGPKAIKEPGRFIRDVEYCQKMVNEFYQKLGDKGLYIGEWHYHPNPNNRPSSVICSASPRLQGKRNIPLINRSC
jgi:integrative and conjugative element protein (TIGR02256 family)